MIRLSLLIALLFPIFTTQAAPPKAQLFEGLGNHNRTVTTNSAKAQEFFNQGLTWLYAFNHDEAIRSFTRASELDKNCAMACWGVSLAAGPQYNHPVMTEERTAVAWDAMQKALARIKNATPVERALIKALKKRNAKAGLDEDARKAHNEAYAEAMGTIWKDNPNDSDIGTLYAEALMVRRPSSSRSFKISASGNRSDFSTWAKETRRVPGR